jgi:hypothetical protein
LWQQIHRINAVCPLETGRRPAHIRCMGRNIAIVVGAGLIALSILVTHHWELIPSGTNGLAATIRLNRWTGSIDVCGIDAKSDRRSGTAAGVELRCIPECPPNALDDRFHETCIMEPMV